MASAGWVPASAETLAEKMGKAIPDTDVESIRTLALKNLQTALCDPDKHCTPATSDEFASPPISIAEGRVAMVQGAISALIQFCGLDYKRNFVPMMDYNRHELKMSERALSLIVLMHGIRQAEQLISYKAELKSCPEGLRAKLDAELPKLPE